MIGPPRCSIQPRTRTRWPSTRSSSGRKWSETSAGRRAVTVRRAADVTVAVSFVVSVIDGPDRGRTIEMDTRAGSKVLIGKGLVDFKTVFTKLHSIGYTGAITIERETSGPQQIEDVRNEKIYLEGILREVLA